MTKYLHQNSIGGELAALLSDTDTEMQSLALGAMQVVEASGVAGIMVVTLDPDGINGAPEYVHVVTHAADANTADILRGQEGSVAREHRAGIEWVHGGSAWWAKHTQEQIHAFEETTTARTFEITDIGCVIEFTNAGASTGTIDPESSVPWPEGAWLRMYAAGVGGVTPTEGAGVTIRNLTALAQYEEALFRYRGSDEWVQS